VTPAAHRRTTTQPTDPMALQADSRIFGMFGKFGIV
jgi:hypothetical protein